MAESVQDHKLPRLAFYDLINCLCVEFERLQAANDELQRKLIRSASLPTLISGVPAQVPCKLCTPSSVSSGSPSPGDDGCTHRSSVSDNLTKPSSASPRFSPPSCSQKSLESRLKGLNLRNSLGSGKLLGAIGPSTLSSISDSNFHDIDETFCESCSTSQSANLTSRSENLSNVDDRPMIFNALDDGSTQDEASDIPLTEAENQERMKLRTREITKKLGRGGAIGQHIQAPKASRVEKVSLLAKCMKQLRRCRSIKDVVEFVKHPAFDTPFAILIFANTVAMCFEVQYRGFDLGYDVNYPTSPNPSEIAWPGAGIWFDYLLFGFGAAFTFELVVKLAILRLDFFKSIWNWFDTLVVSVWLTEQSGLAELLLNPNVLRSLRLVRLVRLTRMVSIIEALDSLQVLVGSIKACVSVLVWSASVLMVVMVIMGMVLNGLLEDYIINAELLSDRQEMFKYFGTFTRTMVSMYELTLGNWIPITRSLIEKVSELYGPLILTYRFIVGFAIVRVITGVFLHETFKVAAMDDDLMILQKQRSASRHRRKMLALIKQADSSNDGVIQKDEFLEVLENQRIKTWLAAMDLEVADGDVLFEFLNHGDGNLTPSDMVNGISRLKGAARSIDVVGLSFRMTALEDLIEELYTKVQMLCHSLEN